MPLCAASTLFILGGRIITREIVADSVGRFLGSGATTLNRLEVNLKYSMIVAFFRNNGYAKDGPGSAAAHIQIN